MHFIQQAAPDIRGKLQKLALGCHLTPPQGHPAPGLQGAMLFFWTRGLLKNRALSAIGRGTVPGPEGPQARTYPQDGLELKGP